MNIEYKAFEVSEIGEKKYQGKIVNKNIDNLEQGDVLIKVKYSSLNYKDALSSIGNKGVTRSYPHVLGIDAAGIVVDSKSSKFKNGDEVIVTGFDLGMNTSGGLAEYIRVPVEWLVNCPQSLNLKEAMFFGTAGFTAALSVLKLLESGVTVNDGPILVTGASGGVASVAIAILAKLGYSVTAASGKKEAYDFLKKIGATDIIDRTLIDDDSNKAMLKSKWAGVVDTVGGNILATAIKTCKYNATVTTCGNVAGDKFSSSVYPFILRGVSLVGIDSVQCSLELRDKVWSLLANNYKFDFEGQYQIITLYEVASELEAILKGNHSGRTVVEL